MPYQFITKKVSSTIVFLMVITVLFGLNIYTTYASTTNGTITGGGNNGYGWSSQAGWINFAAPNGNISITDSGITGYAWNANYGWINMSPTNGGVSIAAGGSLSGSAWSSGAGWVNFSGVSINSSGKFIGQASGSGIGTLTFDCDNCSVVTDYRPSDFRTTPSPTPTPSGGGGGGGGGGGFFTQPQTPSSPGTGTESPNNGTEGTPNPDNQSTGAGTGVALPTQGDLNQNRETASPIVAPAQLFDIRLLLDRTDITRIADLVARVTFTSFGRVPTPVDMSFSILDADGKEILKNVDTTTVQTEAVFVKRFSGGTELSPGAYILRLHTTYNKDVEDTFEAKFTVSLAASPSYRILWFIGGLTLLILITLFFIWRKRRQDAGNITARPY